MNTTIENVEKVLAETREEVLRHMDRSDPFYQGMNLDRDFYMAWYFTHVGEIEMAFHLGLITQARCRELKKEWETHHPDWSGN